MNFYSLDVLPLVDDSFAMIDDVPRELVKYRYRMATGLEMGERFPADARFDMHETMPGIKLPSLVGNASSLLIVSKPVKEVIEKAKTGEIEYLPLSIYNHKKRLASRDYFLINPLGTFDCLDLDRSDILYNKGDIVAVKKIVLDSRKLGSAPDLFRIPETPETYVISERLAAALKAIQATNVYLFDLEQSSGAQARA